MLLSNRDSYIKQKRSASQAGEASEIGCLHKDSWEKCCFHLQSKASGLRKLWTSEHPGRKHRSGRSGAGQAAGRTQRSSPIKWGKQSSRLEGKKLLSPISPCGYSAQEACACVSSWLGPLKDDRAGMMFSEVFCIDTNNANHVCTQRLPSGTASPWDAVATAKRDTWTFHNTTRLLEAGQTSF